MKVNTLGNTVKTGADFFLFTQILTQVSNYIIRFSYVKFRGRVSILNKSTAVPNLIMHEGPAKCFIVDREEWQLF